MAAINVLCMTVLFTLAQSHPCFGNSDSIYVFSERPNQYDSVHSVTIYTMTYNKEIDLSIVYDSTSGRLLYRFRNSLKDKWVLSGGRLAIVIRESAVDMILCGSEGDDVSRISGRYSATQVAPGSEYVGRVIIADSSSFSMMYSRLQQADSTKRTANMRHGVNMIEFMLIDSPPFISVVSKARENGLTGVFDFSVERGGSSSVFLCMTSAISPQYIQQFIR